MWCVILQPKGTTRNAVVPEAQRAGIPDAALAGAILRRATAPVVIGTWKWSKLIIHLFAYKAGKAGTENKHELPPPHDTILLFGDAILFATTADGKLTTFNVEAYTKFYNEALGGFEDLDSDEDETDIDSDLDEEEEEEVDDDVSADESEESESEEEIELEEEEALPVPKTIKIPKRTNKKIPAWYNLTPLEKEPYTLG
jgi:hypothetical protein